MNTCFSRGGFLDHVNIIVLLLRNGAALGPVGGASRITGAGVAAILYASGIPDACKVRLSDFLPGPLYDHTSVRLSDAEGMANIALRNGLGKACLLRRKRTNREHEKTAMTEA